MGKLSEEVFVAEAVVVLERASDAGGYDAVRRAGEESGEFVVDDDKVLDNSVVVLGSTEEKDELDPAVLTRPPVPSGDVAGLTVSRDV